MSMVENVARALWDRDRNSYMAMASAAIEAIREPTDAMIDVGYGTFEEAYDPAHCYRMMIDAALAENGK